MRPDGLKDVKKAVLATIKDPLGRAPLLHMEMILFVARAEKRRPELAKRLRAQLAALKSRPLPGGGLSIVSPTTPFFDSVQEGSG